MRHFSDRELELLAMHYIGQSSQPDMPYCRVSDVSRYINVSKPTAHKLVLRLVGSGEIVAGWEKNRIVLWCENPPKVGEISHLIVRNLNIKMDKGMYK